MYKHDINTGSIIYTRHQREYEPEPESQPKIIEITHTPPNSRAGNPQLKTQEEGRRVSIVQV
jgi:hypothetical protein